jgi:cytochrome P450
MSELMSKAEVRTAPGRVPLLGHVPSLRRDPLGFMRSLRNHGDMTRIFLGRRPVYVVNSTELVRRVLVVESRKFDKGALFDELRAHIGNGLVTSSGDFHRRQRRLAQPAYHPERINRYAEHMAHRTDDMASSWLPDRPVDIDRSVDRLVRLNFFDTLFEPAPPPETMAAIEQWLSVKHQAMRRTLSPLPPRAQRILSRRTDNGLRGLLCELVAQRRAAKADGGDLTSMLLLAREPRTGEHMNDVEVCDELLTLFVAGIGTVSAALAWACHEVARHPEVDERLSAELRTVLSGRLPTAADIGELHYTRRVLQEVLRLHPVWLLMRRAVAPVEIGGVEMAPGDEVFFSPHALHRDPSLYLEPDRFDPDRWIDDRAACLPRGAFLPFGAGNRLCVGEGFAWTEMTIVVATIMARWRLEPVPGHEVRSRVGTVVRPTSLPMYPIPRSGVR